MEKEKVLNQEMQSHINPLIERELLKTLGQFFNEIDVAFDNVERDVVNKLHKFLKTLDNIDNMTHFVKTTFPILKSCEDKISYIMTSKRKLKSSDYDFMNDICLFNDILNFGCFSSENKGTKKSLVKYLYNIYMSVFILNFGVAGDNSNIDLFTQQISQFMKSIQDKMEQDKMEQNKVKQEKMEQNKNKMKQEQNKIAKNSAPELGGMGNLLNSLMSNQGIMSLATDLSKDIEKENIDPMLLLSSLMSGRPDSRIESLVSNITEKIETKINNGELDKTQLEQQANTMLNSINSGNLGEMFSKLN